MGILKKLKRTGPLTVGDIAKVIMTVDKMKQNGLLKTTDLGYFEIFPELLDNNQGRDVFCKNLYYYARQCKLIGQGESLDLVDIETNELLALVSSKGVNYIPRSDK